MSLEWIELDVRPVLASGREPFLLIMNHLETLEPNQGLCLQAPFYPEPLVNMLQRQRWTTEAEETGPDHWTVRIQRSGTE